MLAEKSSQIWRGMIGLLSVVLILGAAPALATDIYVDAGGPYEADVGEEIEFDASGSYMADGSEILTYYWDFNGDGVLEGFSDPKVKHIWHSAWKGEVMLYIFYDEGVAVDDAEVEVSGPTTELVVTLRSTADLHLFGPGGEHAGLNYDTGFYDMEIVGAALQFVPDILPGISPTESKITTVPQISTTLFDGGTFDVELVGTADDAFLVVVQGFVDGQLVSEDVVDGIIFDEETVAMEIDARYGDGALTVDVGKLVYCPDLEADPDDIDVAVEPDTTHVVEIKLRETEGQRDALGVTLLCGDLTNDVYTIEGAEIRFDRNNIDIAKGGEEVVNMSIPIPTHFVGKVTGTLTVSCGGETSLEIPVSVRKAGLHGPVAEGGGPYLGAVGTAVTFDASGSIDPDGEIEKYCWDWDLDGIFDDCTEDATIDHTWNAAYTGLVILKVEDDDGYTDTQVVPVTILGAE